MQLKLKNKRLQDHIDHLSGGKVEMTPFSEVTGRITYEGGLTSSAKIYQA